MDPLSFTASLIAVIAAVTTTAKQLEQLRTALRDASSTLCLVSNEISDLNVVLRACESAVKELFENSSEHERPTALAEVASVFGKTTKLLHSLENAVRSCLKFPDKEGEEIRVEKIRWLREKSKITKLRNELRERKQDILVLMESHSL
jgi:chromosome segregation ATPase